MIMLASGGNETENKIEFAVTQLLPPQRSSQQAAFVFPNITSLFFTASMGWSHKADADQDNWSHSLNSVPYPVLANVASGIPGTSAAGTKLLCLTATQ